jgi:hypothetical protein
VACDGSQEDDDRRRAELAGHRGERSFNVTTRAGAWVESVVSASGRFSAGLNAIPQNTGCGLRP